MTCIVAVVQNGKIYMGGDSLGLSNLFREVRSDPKVFRNGPFLIGCTTSFRMGNLLRYKMQIPVHPDGMDIMEYMCTEFIKEVRTCLKLGGFNKTENSQDNGGDFLVGYRDHLFYIGSDYQVGQLAANYHAVGSGREVAVGSLFSTDGMPPEQRLKIALEAATHHNAGVGPPFVIESL